MAAINMYEASNDIPKMTGKEFRLQAKSLLDGNDFIETLGKEVKKINTFKSNNASWLKYIRLYCAAHRDQGLGEKTIPNKNLHMDCFQRSTFVQVRCAHIIAKKNYADSNQ